MRKILNLICVTAFLAAIAFPALAAVVPSQYATIGPGGVGTLTPPMSRYVNAYALTANTAETITWPQDALWCNISSAAPFWVNVNATATIPSTDVTTGLSSAYNIGQRAKGSEGSFSIISATSQQISVEFWGQ